MTTTSSTPSATSGSIIQNPSPGQDAYIPKQSGEVLQAQDWNDMQVAIHTHINNAYEELGFLLRKIDEVKKQLEDLQSDSMAMEESLSRFQTLADGKILEDRLRTGFQETTDGLGNEIRQSLAQKIDKCPPFSFQLTTPATFTIERKNNIDTRWSGMIDIISRNTEPPYMSFYHQPPGPGQSPVRYGYVQCGVENFGNSSESRYFSINTDNRAKFLVNGRDILSEIDSIKSMVNVETRTVNASCLNCSSTIKIGLFSFTFFSGGIRDGRSNGWIANCDNVLIKYDTSIWGALIGGNNKDRLHINNSYDDRMNGYRFCNWNGWG